MKRIVGQALRLPDFARGPSTANACLAAVEQRVIYFVTICVEDRQSVLANDKAFAAFKTAIGKLQH
jgi:hypothetical protein